MRLNFLPDLHRARQQRTRHLGHENAPEGSRQRHQETELEEEVEEPGAGRHRRRDRGSHPRVPERPLQYRRLLSGAVQNLLNKIGHSSNL